MRTACRNSPTQWTAAWLLVGAGAVADAAPSTLPPPDGAHPAGLGPADSGLAVSIEKVAERAEDRALFAPAAGDARGGDDPRGQT